MNNCKKCGYYSDGECNICGMGISGEDTFCRLCKDNPNCYYKQLSELKAENERLKEEIKEYKKHSKCAWKCFEGTLCEEGEKYKQTLQEIKEIAEALSCKHPEDCWENTPDWNGEVYGCDVADNWKEPSELATCPSKLASAILQIITKAEEE